MTPSSSGVLASAVPCHQTLSSRVKGVARGERERFRKAMVCCVGLSQVQVSAKCQRDQEGESLGLWLETLDEVMEDDAQLGDERKQNCDGVMVGLR